MAGRPHPPNPEAPGATAATASSAIEIASLRSRCPIASALDVVGDKWTLVVIRDLMWFGKHRFADLLASGEGISTNILAERLERLETAGIIERRRYQSHPPRDEYALTARGRDLEPVLREIVRWGSRHVAGTFQPPPEFLDGPRPSAAAIQRIVGKARATADRVGRGASPARAKPTRTGTGRRKR